MDPSSSNDAGDPDEPSSDESQQAASAGEESSEEPPQGELSAANESEQDPGSAQQQTQAFRGGTMTNEEARKMLQAIRDRDMLRRLRRRAAEQRRRIPVEKDW